MTHGGIRLGLFAVLIAIGGCTKLGDEPLFVEQEAACEAPEPAPKAVTDIFAASCAGSACHTAGGAAGTLSLDPDVAADNLYARLAAGKPDAVRVQGGDADGSYLIQKLVGAAGISGGKMPLGPPLSDEQLETIKTWIAGLPPCESLPSPTDSPTPDVVEPADEGPPLDETTPPGIEPIPDGVATIFDTKCAGCHVGASLGGLALDKDVAAENLVNKASAKDGALRVVPGDADKSYLIDKLRNRNDIGGDPMPQFQAPLPEADIATIEAWINGLEATEPPPPDEDVTQPPVEIDCTPKNDKFKVSYGDVVKLIKSRCATAGCHDAAGSKSSGSLDMTDGDTFLANTVGVSALSSPETFRIHPGSVEKSFLMQKILGAEGVGSQMPLDGSAPLADVDQQLLTHWIEDCASKWAEEGVSTEKP